MEINKVIETKDGPAEISLTLSDEELQFVIEVGLNVLYAHGSIPFVSGDTEAISLMKAPKQAQ